MSRVPAVAAAGVLVAALLAPTAAAQDPEAARWATTVFANVPAPGFPAHAYVHPDGRVYGGTYTNPAGDTMPSRVFEWTADGVLQRSWTVPGQDLSESHGVQVATSDARGRLVLLDRSPARALLLDRSTGAFRRYATFPELTPCAPLQPAVDCSPQPADGPPLPNFAAWGPDGSLYVTDYGQPVIWRVPPGGGTAAVWLADRRLDGGPFGTTGIRYDSAGRRFLVAQQSSAGLGEANPTTGKLYAVRVGALGAPGPMRMLWESRPAEAPDGFAIAESGRVYVALLGTNQLAVVERDGSSTERFPEVPVLGANGSPVPFDSPSSVAFLGTRVLVANQAYLSGNADHHAILSIEVGEQGQSTYIPAQAGR